MGEHQNAVVIIARNGIQIITTDNMHDLIFINPTPPPPPSLTLERKTKKVINKIKRHTLGADGERVWLLK